MGASRNTLIFCRLWRALPITVTCCAIGGGCDVSFIGERAREFSMDVQSATPVIPSWV
jgi:hypothetical protein